MDCLVTGTRAKQGDSLLGGSSRRLRACVEAWPDCREGDYNPSCCRFPKSCSCTVYDDERVSDFDLETRQAAKPVATANVWTLGKSWCVHAKHPDTGSWIRVTGIETQAQAVVEGDALCWKLDREAEAGRV